ncbi:MAG TPA: molybdate ABC transporter substrate-binding protein [Methylophilaceae bacterium]|nr:molybdate ABC transporter substrate-binding protein [Methylophilaceae bacterium]
MNMNKAPAFLAGLCLLLNAALAVAENKVTVFAAASLTNAISEIAADYEKQRGVKVAASYAGSAALAKQIANGAPADVFISADTKWMDYLQSKKKIAPESRRDLLGNRLVIIAPKGRGYMVNAEKGFDFSKAFDGRLCTGDLASVPAGVYAKQSLTALGWWDAIKSRIVGTHDVRAALAFVERGECAAGIVYETDAKISEKVELVATLPDDTHAPIVYPIAAVAGASLEGRALMDYLSTLQASAIFARHGFTVIAK